MADPKVTVRFVPDRTLNRQLRKDPQFQAHLFQRAQDVAGVATANGRRVNRTYAAEVSQGPEGLPRVEADALPSPRNANFGGVASWIEWGTQDAPARAPLRRAVESCGLRLSDRGADK